jgi:hypothetical protein
MQATKRILVAGLMAAGLMVLPMGLSVALGGSGPGLGLISVVSTVYALPVDTTGGEQTDAPVRPVGGTVQKVSTNPTGDSGLDDLCQQAADLINNAQAEGDRAANRGDSEQADAWWQLAADMTTRAEGWGCDFIFARIRQVDSRVPGGLNTASR